MLDVDGTNIDGFHFLGTGSYRFGSQEQVEEYLDTTWGPSAVAAAVDGYKPAEKPEEKAAGKGLAYA